MQDAEQAGRILVVDDEKAIVETLHTIFTTAGYDCRCFQSSEEFWEKQDAEWVADFALLDVVLPGTNGVELAIKLHELYPQMKITLFSAHFVRDEILQSAHEKGYNFEFLMKPVHPADLLDLICKALHKKK